MRFGNRESRIGRRGRIGLWFFVAFAAISLSGATPQAQDAQPESPITLAVLNFVNRNPGDGWDWLGKGLADMLITDLSKSASLIVVERDRMAEMLKELELAECGIADASTAGNVGCICKVERVLFGSYFKDGDRLRIEAHIVEVETADLLRVELVEGKAAEVFALEKALAHGILTRLNVPLTKVERQLLMGMPTDSIDALTHYSRALNSYDLGDCSGAIVEFRLALNKDANYQDARLRLGDAYLKLNEIEHALVEYCRLTRNAGYEIDRADVQAQIVRMYKNRYERSYGKDEATKKQAGEALDAIFSGYRKMIDSNRVPNRAMEQIVLCYEKLGDMASAALCCIKLLNFLQFHHGYIRGEGNDLCCRTRRKADELYGALLREGAEANVPLPAEMIRVAEDGLVLESDAVPEIAKIALELRQRGWGDMDVKCVAPPGKEFSAVRVTITTPPCKNLQLHRGINFGEWGHGPHAWGYYPSFPPNTQWETRQRDLPAGVRAIRIRPHQGVTQWRVCFDLGPQRLAEGMARFSQSGYSVTAFPKQVTAIFVDGRPIRVNLGYCGGELPFPPGEHEARVVWADGAEKSCRFVIQPGEAKRLTVMRDSPFDKCAKPIAPRGSNPSLLFDRDGKLWLYWDEASIHGGDPSQESGIHFAVSTDGGFTWSEPRLWPLSGLKLDMRPILQQDRRGTYWLVWCSSRDVEDPMALWISSSQDNSRWKVPWKVVLPGSEDARASGGRDFSFAISAQDILWIASRGQLWHSDDGKTWDGPTPVDVKASGYPGSFCHLHAGAAGGITLVGVRPEGVVLSTSRKGKQWSEPRVILEGRYQTVHSSPVLAEDAKGRRVLLVGPSCRVQRASGDWSLPFKIETHLMNPSQPAIAVSAAGRWAVVYASNEGLVTASADNIFGGGEPSRIVNLSTGVTTERHELERFEAAPGDHLAMALDNDYSWHYVWTGSEAVPLGFSEGTRLRIKGARRLANLTTGASATDADNVGIEIAAGDRIAIALGDGYTCECVWEGKGSFPPAFHECTMRGYRCIMTRHLCLGRMPQKKLVGMRGYWGALAGYELPESWECYQDLVSLDLNSSDIADLAPLSVLKNLRYLNLADAYDISDLSPLSALPDLTVLNLNYCHKITDLSPLSKLQNLAWVDLVGCKGVATLTPLAALPNLRRLRVEVQDAADLAAVARLRPLTHLDLICKGNIADLSPLSGLTNLTSLQLACFGDVSDLSPLSNLRHLASLKLSQCGGVRELNPLAGIPRLEELAIGPGCAISAAEIQAFRKTNPECEIRW